MRCKGLSAETEDGEWFVLRVFWRVDVCQRMLLSVGKTQLQQLLKVLQNKLRNGKLSGRPSVGKVLQASSKKSSKKRRNGSVNNPGAVEVREVKNGLKKANYPIRREISD